MMDGFGVRFAFFPASGSGAELSSLNIGDSYVMRTFVQDQRVNSSSTIPSGILQAAFDVPYDPTLLQFTGSVRLGSEFQRVPGQPANGEILSTRLDNLNGRDSTQPIGDARDDEFLFFEINVTALAAGSVDLDAVNANEPNLRAEFYLPFAEVTEFDVTGDQIEIVGGGVIFTNTNGLQVTEGDSATNFQVALNRQPTGDVSFNIASQTANQVTLNTSRLTFTPQNWNTAQTVQVTAINDSVAETGTSVVLQTGVLESSDSSFDGTEVNDITVTVNDNDTAGVQIDPPLSFTDEDGTADSVDVRLTSQPTSPVTISFLSGDTGEVTVSPSQFVFDESNWNLFRTLNFTGVDDDEIDGDQDVAISLSLASADPFYDSLSVPAVTVSNEDTTVAGLLVQPNAGLITGESEAVGGSDIFNVRLQTRPSSNVLLNVASSDTSEGVPATSQLTFTPENWDDIQVVSVSGVDDQIIDGDVVYQVTVTPDPSSDPDYASLPASTVMLTNRDDDTASLLVSTPNRSFTTEEGGTATFTVQLSSEPVGTVTVNSVSTQTNEATVSPSSLTFDSSNWDLPRTVTVTGVDDVAIDGDASFNVVITSNSTTEPDYDGLSESLTLINNDDDVAGITLTNVDNLTTSEAGQSDTFSIRLSAQPLANVSVRLASSDTNEVTVSPSTVTFTPSNWNIDQTVTLNGVNDSVIDGDATANITFNFSTSADSSYRDFTQSPLVVTNQGDQARLLIQPVSGLVTSESVDDGNTDTFSVRLTRQPTSDVTLNVVSSDTGEGIPDVNQVVFTPQNFDQPQTVTVTGVNDDLTDGDQAYEVTLTPTAQSDALYRDLPTSTVMLTNEDDDVPALLLGAANPSATTEAGGVSQFNLRLRTQPTGTVTVSAASGDTTEGIVAQSTFTFNESNWDQNQSVVVTGVDDEIVDGNIAYSITLTPSSTTDANYNDVSLVRNVSLTNTNDDVAGVDLIDATDLRTDENGLVDSFGVRLRKQPLGNVTINLTSNSTSEVTVSPASLQFTPSNWNQTQSVALTGIDDGLVVDGDQTASISLDLSTSTDAAYQNVSVGPVSVVNIDNDIPSVNVAAADPIVVREDGTTSGTFTITLATPPTQPVTITAASQDTSEGIVAPNTLTFNASNFNQPQTITVTAVDDDLVDEDVLFNIALTATSGDTAYNGISITPVSVQNINDDEGNVRVIGAQGLTVSETGSQASFEVVLTTQPTQDVSIPLAVSDASELTIELPGDATSLVFTPQNWNVSQTVNVTGLADSTVDGDIVSQIQAGPTSSTDLDFNSLPVAPVSVTNVNIDTASLSVTSVDFVEGNAGETNAIVFTVQLDGAVESGVSLNYVTVAAASGIAAEPSVDFGAVNGNLSLSGNDGATMQISVPIIADAIVESNETLALELSGLTTSSAGIDVNDIVLPATNAIARILNDDTATITVASSGPASRFEGNSSDRPVFTALVTLSAAVQGGATIEVATSDGTATIANNDYVALTESLSLGGSDPLEQSVTIEIVGDDAPEPDELLALALNNLSASDQVIRDAISLSGSPVEFTILNDDAPRLVVRQVSVDNTEGSSTTPQTFRFEVELSADVNDPDGFSVPVTTINGTADSLSDFDAVDTVLDFTGVGGQVQSFDVVITGDSVVESDETFVVQLGTPSDLADGAELVIPDPEVTATIVNDDSASISLVASQTSVAEGDDGTTTDITFTATLNGSVDRAFTVDYATSDITAFAGSDYISASDTISFTGESGQSQTFTVTINGDSVLETNEQFAVALSSIGGVPDSIRDSISLPSQATEIEITADDRASLSITGRGSINEGDAAGSGNELVLDVVLSNAVESEFDIEFATGDGTAVSGSDYEATSGRLTFAAGSVQSQTIRVPVMGDSTVETDETLEVSLGNLIGLPDGLSNFIDILNSSADGVITNDDSATISIQGPGQVSEPGAPGTSTLATYTVTLSAPVQGGVRIAYATTDGTAIGGATSGDFDPVSGVLDFAESGSLSQSFTVTVQGDSQIEESEGFSVLLGDLSNIDSSLMTSVSVSNSSVTTTIADDDSVTVSFLNINSSVAETSGFHEIEVELTTTGGAVLSERLEVDVVVTSSGTAGQDDFTLSTSRLIFPAGSAGGAIQIVRLALNDDGQTEPTESIVLSLQPVGDTTGVSVSSTDHSVSVTDDPRDAVISGFVWADTDFDSVRESHELGISRVTVRLTGTEDQGGSVSMETVTDRFGRYEFRDLAAGNYSIAQVQPEAFHDGSSVMENPTESGTEPTVATNSLSQIRVDASVQVEGVSFSERGYRADQIPMNAFFSRPIASLETSLSSQANSGISVLDSIFDNWT